MGEDIQLDLTDDQRAELRHRLANPLQVITSGAELIMLTTESDEDRIRARGVLTSAKRLEEELKGIFGI